jgi:serine/threonine-protein kinase
MCGTRGRKGKNSVQNHLDTQSVVTLRYRLDTGVPLSLAEASAIIDRVAESLDAMHLRGVVHGAVTPRNVLLLPDNKVELLVPTETGTVRSPARRSGRSFVGDAVHLSPEEVRGESATAATDIWCLGTMLYEMLTGVAPFVALRLCTLRELVANSEPNLLPQSSATAQFVLDRALAKWPANRFVSAQELANTLWAAAPSHPVTVSSTNAASRTLTATHPAPVPSVQPGVSLQQAVNRPLTLTPSAPTSNRTKYNAMSWLKIFSGRRQTSSSAAA